MKTRIVKFILIGLSVVTAVTLFTVFSFRIDVSPGGGMLSISLSGKAQAAGDSVDSALNERITYGSGEYINNSWASVPLPWNWEMTHDDYHVRIKEDFTAGQVVEFSRGSDVVAFQPMALEWTNDLGQVQQISIPSNVAPVVGTEETELTESVINNQGYVQWNNAYGIGRHFKWECTPGTLEKRLIIDSLASLPTPPAFIINGGNPALRLNLIFDPTTALTIWVDGQLWDKKSKVQTFDFIQFKNGNETVLSFKPLRYWSSDAVQDGDSVATLDKKGNSLYISILVPYSWLQSAVYPVYVDADVTIEASVYSTLFRLAMRAGAFWKSATNAYVIYVDSANDIYYRKTIDGGASWNATLIQAGTIVSFDSWADWQTPGDAGTKIHIAFMDADTDDIHYAWIETSDDSKGTDIIADAGGDGTLITTVDLLNHQISITKSVGGNICVAYRHRDNSVAFDYKFYTSPDGDTWTSKTSPWESINTDYILLFPANLTDTNDIWAVFWDASVNEISLKTWDNSSNDWASEAAEASIATSMTEDTSYLQMDGQVNVNNGHLYFAAWNLLNNAASDLMFWDINGAGSITAKTNIITDTAEYATCSVFINQVNNDIYVAYVGGTDFTSQVACFYQKSTDGGANWGGQTAMQVNAEDDERWVSAGCMKASLGGKFMPIWFNDDLNDIFCNTDNAVSIAASVGDPDISVSPTDYDFGVVAESTTPYTATDYFTITNSSTMQTDQTISVTSATWTGGNAYTHSDTATPGADTVGMKANRGGSWGTGDIIVKYSSPDYIYENCPASTGYDFGIKLYSPISASDGAEKTNTVRITATAD